MPAERMEQLPFSGIRRIFERSTQLEREGADIVHLEMGRPDFDTPQPIKDAAIAALERGEVHYTSNYGNLALRERLAEKLSVENDLEYDPTSEIIVTCGASEAVFVTVLALADRGDEVLIPNPAWTNYEPIIRAAGATPVRYQLDPDQQYEPVVASIAENISPKTELLILNSPNNPTGGVLSAETAQQIARVVNGTQVTVLSDEIYEKLRYRGEHVSPGSLSGMRERTITINGFSKAYSMTGWRLGYLAGPRPLVNDIIRLRMYTSACAPSMAQYAGIRALEGDLSAPLVDQFDTRRQVIMDRIEEIPGMSCPDPGGAFYVFPTIPDDMGDSETFAQNALENAGVALVPGSVFGSTAEERVRIAYANSTERINLAFDRLAEWIQS